MGPNIHELRRRFSRADFLLEKEVVCNGLYVQNNKGGVVIFPVALASAENRIRGIAYFRFSDFSEIHKHNGIPTRYRGLGTSVSRIETEAIINHDLNNMGGYQYDFGDHAVVDL